MATRNVLQMSMKITIFALTCFMLVHSLHAEVNSETVDYCASKSKCSDCIQTIKCSWCIEDDIMSNMTRCFPSDTNSACKNPKNPKSAITPKKKGTDQNKQQRVTVQLRIGKFCNDNIIALLLSYNRSSFIHAGDSLKIPMKYTQTDDNAVDLYYLLDVSSSMKQHKDTLSSVGERLHEQMKDITSNFRLGFGSFVDKVLMPYVDTNPEK